MTPYILSCSKRSDVPDSAGKIALAQEVVPQRLDLPAETWQSVGDVVEVIVAVVGVLTPTLESLGNLRLQVNRALEAAD